MEAGVNSTLLEYWNILQTVKVRYEEIAVSVNIRNNPIISQYWMRVV